MELMKFSLYRTALMGIAIVWIILYHAPLVIHNSFLSLLKNRGYIGVDIFLLLSGFGLYFGFHKYKSNVKSFYRKRLIRIYPVFFIVVSVSAILRQNSWYEVLVQLSTLGFWFRSYTYAWYISLILLLYLLYPWYMRFFEKKPLQVTVLTSCISMVLAVLFAVLLPFTNFQDLFVRIPIFILGVYWGSLCKISPNMQLPVYLFALFLGMSFFITFMGNKYLVDYKTLINPISCYFMAPAICCICILCLNYVRFIVPFFSFLGSMSLELYLVHGDGFFNYIDQLEGLNRNMWSLIFVLVCILFSYVLYKANECIYNWISKYLQP